MKIWMILGVLVALGAIAAAFKGNARPRRTYAYKAAELLSKGERAFADALEQCLPAGTRLLAKVNLADLLKPASARDGGARFKISQKHVDFVIVDSNWSVVAAIELNDKTHDAPQRRERDEFLKDACEGAGVRLHFVRAASRYDPATLRGLFQPTPLPVTAKPPGAAAT